MHDINPKLIGRQPALGTPENPIAAEAALEVTDEEALAASIQDDLTKRDPQVDVAKADEDDDQYDPNWSTKQKRAWFIRQKK